MGTTFICPICGSSMFHDKGNHITFCAECDHVGWPHDIPAQDVPAQAAPSQQNNAGAAATMDATKPTTRIVKNLQEKH